MRRITELELRQLAALRKELHEKCLVADAVILIPLFQQIDALNSGSVYIVIGLSGQLVGGPRDTSDIFRHIHRNKS